LFILDHTFFRPIWQPGKWNGFMARGGDNWKSQTRRKAIISLPFVSKPLRKASSHVPLPRQLRPCLRDGDSGRKDPAADFHNPHLKESL